MNRIASMFSIIFIVASVFTKPDVKAYELPSDAVVNKQDNARFGSPSDAVIIEEQPFESGGRPDKGRYDPYQHVRNNKILHEQVSSSSKEVDLLKIGHVVPKGRVQDKEYNGDIKAVDELIELGPGAIPYLIGKLADETEYPHPVIDYWRKTTIGDVSLVILCDFVTKSDFRSSSIPGGTWDEIIEKNDKDLDSETALRNYVKEKGRKAIKQKWEIIWDTYKDKLYWDNQCKCFDIGR